jgi:hypothetical protein
MQKHCKSTTMTRLRGRRTEPGKPVSSDINMMLGSEQGGGADGGSAITSTNAEIAARSAGPYRSLYASVRKANTPLSRGITLCFSLPFSVCNTMLYHAPSTMALQKNVQNFLIIPDHISGRKHLLPQEYHKYRIEVKRFSPIFRSLLHIIENCAKMCYIFAKTTLHTTVEDYLEDKQGKKRLWKKN